MNRRLTLSLVLASACVPEAECERRIDAAHRDALRDAALCAYDPDGLDEPECENLDRRPLRTYQAVYCATADRTCIQDDAVAETACFGEPDDASLTSPDPE